MHILKKYYPFDLEKWDINKGNLLEIESVFRLYGKHYNLTEKDLENCDKEAKIQIKEDLKNSDDPLKTFTTIIAMNRMNKLVEKIHEKCNIPISEFSYTITHNCHSFTITLYQNNKEIEIS